MKPCLGPLSAFGVSTLFLALSGCKSEEVALPPKLPTDAVAAPIAPPAEKAPLAEPEAPVPVAPVADAQPAAQAAQAAQAAKDTAAGQTAVTATASASSGNKVNSANSKNTGTSLYDLAARGEATLPTTTSGSTTGTGSTPNSGSTGSTTSGSSIGSTTTGSTGSTTTGAASGAGGNKVTVPNTSRVRVEVPSGLQKALNADPRMQPWLNQVMKVIDDCYVRELKSNASAAGTIVARLTMHSESRPDADIKTLPGALSGVVACATGGLLRTKMPLFTGKEGEAFTVNIHFTK